MERVVTMSPRNLRRMIVACMVAASLSAVWLMATGPGVIQGQVLSLYEADQEVITRQLVTPLCI